jgi:hypothetical protein
VCNEKRLIDTEDPINFKYIIEINGGDQKVFEEHCIAKVSGKVYAAKTVKKTVEKTKKPVLEKPSKTRGSVKVAPAVKTKKIVQKVAVVRHPKMSEEEKTQKELDKQYNKSMLEIAIAKKQADLDVVIRTSEIKRMQLEKSMGNTIPLDLGMSIWAINLKSVYKSLHSQLKNMASTYVEILGGTKDDYNKIMSEMEVYLNNAKNFAKENSKRDIDALVEEYSEVRSRGERKL